MSITLENTTTNADLIIGAYGPNPFIRKKYVPDCDRKYVGYIVWRGIVSEKEVSRETLKAFSENVTVFMRNRHHCLIYIIPGPHGTLQPGEQYLNFARYTNKSPAELERIMVDAKTGNPHRNTVPASRVRADVWEQQLALAHITPLPAPYLEVIAKIKDPFIQEITELSSPSAVFDDGKVVLVGDGLSLLRPHTAFSASQGAFHALTLVDRIEKGNDLKEWETKFQRFGQLHSVQSWWFGYFYQGNMFVSAISAVSYWGVVAVNILRAWWRGEERLLRTV